MLSRALVAFVAVTVAGIAALAFAASRDESDLAFTLGVVPGTLAAELPPGSEACQRPVRVGETFTGVRLQLGTYERPGPPLAITIRVVDGLQRLSRGRLERGYPDVSEQTVELDDPVGQEQRVAVCVRNVGDRRVAIYGGPELARRDSSVVVDGEAAPTDMTLIFTRDSRSALTQLPEIFERASAFRPAWVGPWTFWALAGLLLLVAPAVLAAALHDAFRSRS